MRKPEYDVWIIKEGITSTSSKVYLRRWFMLFLFVLYSASSAVHWLEYTSIPFVVEKLYKVSHDKVDQTSTIFLLTYLLLSWVGWYLLEKMSFRWTVIVGMIGTCVAAWMKVLSTSPERFWIVMLAQIISGISMIVVIPAIPKVAATWFGPNEVSAACGIGIFGVLLGNAFGFILPRMFVNVFQQLEEIQINLQALHLAISFVSAVVLILLVRYLEEKPPVHPSPIQMRGFYETEPKTGKATWRVLLGTKSYCILLVSYSLVVASMYALIGNLHRMIEIHSYGTHYAASSIFLNVILSGMLGCIGSGVILDHYKNFKFVALVAYIMSFVAMICFTVAFTADFALVFITAALLSFSMSGLLTIGFELAIELTYPEQETVSCGILMTVSLVLGVIFMRLYKYLLYIVVDTFANTAVCGVLLIGCLLIVFIPKDYKRQATFVNRIRIY